jgi:hypothetical protein
VFGHLNLAFSYQHCSCRLHPQQQINIPRLQSQKRQKRAALLMVEHQEMSWRKQSQHPVLQMKPFEVFLIWLVSIVKSFNNALKTPEEIATSKFESNAAANTTLAIQEVENSSAVLKETIALTSSATPTTSENLQTSSSQETTTTLTQTSTSTTTTTTVKICLRIRYYDFLTSSSQQLV